MYVTWFKLWDVEGNGGLPRKSGEFGGRKPVMEGGRGYISPSLPLLYCTATLTFKNGWEKRHNFVWLIFHFC